MDRFDVVQHDPALRPPSLVRLERWLRLRFAVIATPVLLVVVL